MKVLVATLIAAVSALATAGTTSAPLLDVERSDGVSIVAETPSTAPPLSPQAARVAEVLTPTPAVDTPAVETPAVDTPAVITPTVDTTTTVVDTTTTVVDTTTTVVDTTTTVVDTTTTTVDTTTTLVDTTVSASQAGCIVSTESTSTTAAGC